MAASSPDPRIDVFLNALPAWQGQLLSRVRQLIHEAEPAIIETIKRRTWPFFVLEGNICAFMAAKDHVNILIYDPLAPDPAKLINQGQDNKTARAIQIYEHQSFNEAAFKNLIQAVAANNRAGGWRKLQQS
jgi:hypothetical protein